MADITLSKAVRSNLLNLQNTANQLAKTQERLATGLKVNSALDNPTNFFTSSSLNSRAGDLSRLLDSVSTATQTIEAANNGLTAITQLIENAQATARQALQTAGRVTENVVEGLSSAPYNPQALSVLNGDNTGTGALTADAAASIDLFAVAEDAATISSITTGDLDTGAADGLGNLSDASPNGPGFGNGESITFTINGVDYTANFTAGGAVGARTGDATTGYAINIGIATTLTALDTNLNTLLTGSGVTVSSPTTEDNLTFAFDATVDTVTLADGAADGTTLAKLNLDGVGADKTATGANTGDRFLARNSTFQTYFAANAEGATLAVALGGTTLGTLTFGSDTAGGEINNKTDLTAALHALSGLSATNAGGGGAITVTNSDAGDADSAITFTASTVALNSALAFDTSSDDGGLDLDSATGLVTTSTATNLLTQGAVSSGDAITLKVGSQATLTITFGTGTGQVSTIAELNAALAYLAGGAASVDSRGEINVTSDSAQDSIVVAGTTSALASFGLTAGETNNLLTTTTGIVQNDKLNIQVGTNTMLTITFGTGTGEVNTFDELQAALDNLAGGTATIDSTTGAITVTATNGADDITITSTDGSSVSDDTVAEAFGLTNSATPIAAVTVDNAVRTELETQFNTLLSQIDELAEDAGFNGINLLDGNDLSVIFNEDASSKLEINGVVFDSSGLGLSSVASGYFQTDANIESTLDSLTDATDLLRAQASTFGSNISVVEARQDFTKKMINTLETGASNLTLADTNEEAANLLALQTRQQLSSTALSLASQSDQSVLRLFQ